MSTRPLAVIGFGNMGGAIIAGALRAGIISRESVFIADSNAHARERAAAMGLDAFEHPQHALHAMAASEPQPGRGVLLLAVKPQMLSVATDPLRAAVGARFVISILAGVTAQRVQRAFGGSVIVARAMPNLPAAIGQGVTALFAGPGVPDDDAAFAQSLFRGVGHSVMPLDESLIDAFTAVAGSGPAYLFYLAENMIRGAIAQGLTPSAAREAVVGTLQGASTMLQHDARGPDELRRAVTSPGGTTQAAITVLDQSGVAQAVQHAIEAATARGRELGATA